MQKCQIVKLDIGIWKPNGMTFGDSSEASVSHCNIAVKTILFTQWDK